MAMQLAALGCGLVFGWGLQISGMTDPRKILNFLDFFGTWDPSLAVVMAAALAVAMPGLAFAKRRGRPILATESLWPSNTAIDRTLFTGAAIFGVGWGLIGLCPGPALENLATLSPRVVAFVIAMAIGMIAVDLWRSRAGRQVAEAGSTG
jgi:uncharacterized membrane protein YedE/YeeE